MINMCYVSEQEHILPVNRSTTPENKGQ